MWPHIVRATPCLVAAWLHDRLGGGSIIAMMHIANAQHQPTGQQKYRPAIDMQLRIKALSIGETLQACMLSAVFFKLAWTHNPLGHRLLAVGLMDYLYFPMESRPYQMVQNPSLRSR